MREICKKNQERNSYWLLSFTIECSETLNIQSWLVFLFTYSKREWWKKMREFWILKVSSHLKIWRSGLYLHFLSLLSLLLDLSSIWCLWGESNSFFIEWAQWRYLWKCGDRIRDAAIRFVVWQSARDIGHLLVDGFGGRALLIMILFVKALPRI